MGTTLFRGAQCTAGNAPSHPVPMITARTLITWAAFPYNPISLASLCTHRTARVPLSWRPAHLVAIHKGLEREGILLPTDKSIWPISADPEFYWNSH